MVGKVKAQRGLFDVGTAWPVALDPKSFHGQLAGVSGQLFRDEEFASLYSDKVGRPSVPPSLLALVLLMQAYEGLSDEDAVEHTSYDLRWAAVLHREAGTPLCAKSTLQLFRAHLILHHKLELLLRNSLQEARRSGLLQGNKFAIAVDTKPMLGRGAVQDTYNLVATGMKQLARAMARSQAVSVQQFVTGHGFGMLGAPSVKGAADIDWSDEAARNEFLSSLVSEARRLMALADARDPAVKAAAIQLEQLLLQDIQEAPLKDEGPDDGNDHGDGQSNDGQSGDGQSGDGNNTGLKASIKQGTVQGRMPSATDPDQRHGRKSKSKRFVGSKSSVAVDTGTGLILATEILSGDAGDATGLMELVAKAGEIAEGEVTEVLGDCAYGSGETRQQFANAECELIAKVPAAPTTGKVFPKSAFRIELPLAGQSLEYTKVFCPGGNQADRLTGSDVNGFTFYFDSFCKGCQLREQCTTSQDGRSLHIHPQERLIREAREFQSTTGGRAKLRQRLIVENGLARLSHLGIGQARYIGKIKSRFQLAVAATVANLRRTWNWAGQENQREANRMSPVTA